jgi:hypothetical protein
MLSPSRFRAWELFLTFTLGAANVGSELWGKGKALVVTVGLLSWGVYLVYRQRQEPGFWRAFFQWPPAWRLPLACLGAFTVVTLAFSAAIGWGRPLPGGEMLLMALLYVPWGVAQQFLLNAVLAHHLRELSPRWGGLGAAVFFALAHAPQWPVVAAVFPAALFWVWLYRKLPNLALLGLAHSLAGTAFFSWACGRTLGESLQLTLR